MTHIVLIRVEASGKIGTGHLRRCLTLADALAETGAAVHFVCNRLPDALANSLRQDHSLHLLSGPSMNWPQENGPDELAPKDQYANRTQDSWAQDAGQTRNIITSLGSPPDWLIVDHYGLDARWEAAMRPYVERIMVLDDLADRPHDCDILLDQNYYEGMQARYAGLVPPTCLCFLGPRYVLLRPEFRRWRGQANSRNGSIERILVSFGGADTGNLTVAALRAVLARVGPQFAVDVVIGSVCRHREEIASLAAEQDRVTLHVETKEIAALMAAADLSVGAFGATTWERCFMGLPTVGFAVADNQVEAAEALAKLGATHYLGRPSSDSEKDIAQALSGLVADPARLRSMSRKSADLVPDCDGAEVIASYLAENAHV